MRWHLMGLLMAWAGGVCAQTATLQIEVPQAPVAVRVGAVDHLVYELHLRNSGTEPMTIGSVEVLTGDPARRLLLLEGDTLCKQFEALEPPARKRPACELPASGLALVYLWQPVSIAPGTRLVHRVATDTGAVEGGAATVNPRAPVALSPPLRGGPWVAVYDPTMRFGHRQASFLNAGRRIIPARFAVDLIRLDHEGRPGASLQDFERWHGLGAEVLAVADGVIAKVRDGRPDELRADAPPRPGATADDVAGNYIALDLGGGRHAFYEHLRSGSILVKPGQRVARGDVIARLGRSGINSSGPHLHFHVADTDSTLHAEGLPFVWTRFEALGRYASVDDAERGVAWPRPPGCCGAMTMAHPEPNSVLLFDER